MSLTTNISDPGLGKIRPDGQQEAYLVLSEEERAKGFVMPVYRKYRHLKRGADTTMGLALCETYARNPEFYSGTYCCCCGTHFPLVADGAPQFLWVDGAGRRQGPVGFGPEGTAAWLESRRREEIEKHLGEGI